MTPERRRSPDVPRPPDQPHHRPSVGGTNDEVLAGYLPLRIRRRFRAVAPKERPWRLRTVLLLWSLGYALDHAVFLAMADDRPTIAAFEASLARFDDERLVACLEATADERGDGSVPFESPLWRADAPEV